MALLSQIYSPISNERYIWDIYAGGGVVSCNAADEMAEFVKKVNAPVSLSLMGQCAFDN